MRLLGYANAVCPKDAQHQLICLRRFARRHGHELAACVADSGVAVAASPLLRRPGGAGLAAQLRALRADALATVQLSVAFPRPDAVLWILAALLPHVGLPCIALEEPPLPRFGAYRPIERSSSDQAPLFSDMPMAFFGCVRHAGHLYRDPWTWPIREQIVALHRDVGQTLEQVRDTMNRLGLSGSTTPRAWQLQDLSDIVATHGQVAIRAIRDPLTAGGMVRDPESAHYHGLGSALPTPCYRNDVGRSGA